MSKFKDQIEDKNEESIDGRIRSFPHQRNQFLVHFYIELNENSIIEDLKLIFNTKENNEKGIHFNESQMHLTIIRGHYCLRYHQIQDFFQSIHQKLKTIFSFNICLNEIKVLENEEKTRQFISICESNPNPNSKLIIEAIDCVLNEFNLSPFSAKNDFKQHLYHSSIAWFLPKSSSFGIQLTNEMNDYFDEPFIIKVDQIFVKVGNICKTFSLNNF
jgi:hypothetical protein